MALRVLNVGGGASRELPSAYSGWEQSVLDIDPQVNPDICCDAKNIGALAAESFDAVYCSHNLEHFYKHDVPLVLQGFHHVINAAGFAHIIVPDVMALIREVAAGKRDVSDEWYRAPSGPVTFHDVLYGWNWAMEDGNLFYAHKCGFSEKSLTKAVRAADFATIYTSSDGKNLHAFAFKRRPTGTRLRSLGIA